MSLPMERFEAIVVGLGHAGVEAALACARLGLATAGVTLRRDGIAAMSCNPSIGGTAKGHMVRELDALGGEMGRVADRTAVHVITLNSSRGSAVQATRALCERELYAATMRATLEATPGLTIVEGEVVDLLASGGPRPVVGGVVLADGRTLEAKLVVLTTGTFLRAVMHTGAEQAAGGRVGEPSAEGLSAGLRRLGFELRRFKTGTPARLVRESIEWEACQRQPSEPSPRPFSLRTPPTPFPQRPTLDCFITHTNPATHKLLEDNLAHSPLFSGRIVGRGPRYCPSIEDKVVRFAGRDRHTVFLQPEGATSPLVYPAGLSTSMPPFVQEAFLRSIRGLEKVDIARFGYAVEYDYAPPTQLLPTLEAKGVAGLYFAGQLNGTSGYEEAAFQGLWAGINAVRSLRGAPPFHLTRAEAHGAVLIDELVHRGVDEPFRMLTSRSEHRLRLREGNAEFRLRAHGHRVGLVTTEELQRTEARAALIAKERLRLRARGLEARLRQHEVHYQDVALADAPLPPELAQELEVEVKYEGYVRAADVAFERASDAHDELPIPLSLDFRSVEGLSSELKEKLSRLRPTSLGELRKVQGLTPPALLVVLLALKKGTPRRAEGC